MGGRKFYIKQVIKREDEYIGYKNKVGDNIFENYEIINIDS